MHPAEVPRPPPPPPRARTAVIREPISNGVKAEGVDVRIHAAEGVDDGVPAGGSKRMHVYSAHQFHLTGDSIDRRTGVRSRTRAPRASWQSYSSYVRVRAPSGGAGLHLQKSALMTPSGKLFHAPSIVTLTLPEDDTSSISGPEPALKLLAMNFSASASSISTYRYSGLSLFHVEAASRAGEGSSRVR